MTYALRQGLSHCMVDRHAVFLDVPADRYFRLADKSEAVFRRLCEGGSVSARELVMLHALGLMEGAVATGELHPPMIEPPMLGAGSMSKAGSAPMFTAYALLAQLRMERFLRSRGLALTVDRLRKEKDGRPVIARGGGVFERWIEGFEQAKLLRSPANRCLPRSMALASRLFRAGHDVSLVMGVRLRPFAAHCWVQHGGRVLNDTPEDVAVFTPILVL